MLQELPPAHKESSRILPADRLLKNRLLLMSFADARGRTLERTARSTGARLSAHVWLTLDSAVCTRSRGCEFNGEGQEIHLEAH